ncbi:hypothetical protein KVH31_31435 [Streptomyces olivaceus]|nr:hypothetical protein [Streptomyces olivaceus]MBZ6211016.1 hypothetical protein [Streptomyces olivaceus]
MRCLIRPRQQRSPRVFWLWADASAGIAVPVALLTVLDVRTRHWRRRP